MRILHLNEFYHPLIFGGAEKSVGLIAEAQARGGHDVAVACTTDGDFAVEERNGVKIYRMPHCSAFWSQDWPKHSKFERFWRKLTMPYNRGMQRHFAHIIEDFGPDIVNTHSMNDVSTGCWGVAAHSGHVVVHTLRNYDLLCSHTSLYHDGKPCGPRCKLISWSKQRQHRVLSGVISNSQETLRLHTDAGLFAQLPEHLKKVIWSISGVEVRPADPSRATLDRPMTFGFFGRILEEKGIGTMIESARLLADEGLGDSFRMIVAGTVSDLARPFVAKAEGLPLKFVGFVEPDEFFDMVDVLLLPSIWPEPLPRSALESYAAGVPVLSSRAGGTPDIVGHDNHEWLFEPGNATELASRIKAIIKRGREGLPSTESFHRLLAETSEPVVLERYMRVYLDALAQSIHGAARSRVTPT